VSRPCHGPPSGITVFAKESQTVELSYPFVAWSLHLYQLIEERAIVDHRSSQVFRSDTAAADAHCDVMCRPVILHDSRMVDRDNLART
jgi:hypothetical protein